MAKILLVEDDNNLREIYGARLEAEGYQILSANDGEAALAVAVKERPELILTDIMMPKISGFDMIDILRSTPETKDAGVIVMTALSQDEDRQRGESLGADRYLVKSQVTLDDVVKMVAEVLDEKATGQPKGEVNQNNDSQLAGSNEATASSNGTDQISSENVTSDQAAALDEEVQNFVSSSPLMNGTPPSSGNQQSAQPAQAPNANTEDQSQPQQNAANNTPQ